MAKNIKFNVGDEAILNSIHSYIQENYPEIKVGSICKINQVLSGGYWIVFKQYDYKFGEGCYVHSERLTPLNTNETLQQYVERRCK